jgi:hypothetical protein
MPATGLDALDFQMNLLAISGSFEAKPGIQLAEVRTDVPDAPSAVSGGSYKTTEGFHHFRGALTAAGKAFYRVGIMYKASSGDATAQVQMGVTRSQCGQTFPPQQVSIHPGMLDPTAISYFPITAFIPLVGATKLKAMFIVTDNSSLKYKLVARSATDPNAPNPWVAVETPWTDPASGNSERNTSEQDVPSDTDFDASANSLMQLGVAVLRAGAGQARGTITAMAAVRY